MSYFSLIPARGGSKGIPRKNLALLGGHPLIAWAIAAAQKSLLCNEIVLTSEDTEILTVGAKYGVNTLIKRPDYLAGDNVKQIEVLRHAFQELDNLGHKFDYVVLLQPTFPFRPPGLVDQAIEAHANSFLASVISVSDVSHIDESNLYSGSLDSLMSVRGINQSDGTLRQSFHNKYWRNGAVYVLNRNDIFRNSLYSNRIQGILMSGDLSINIDSPSDLEHSRNFLDTAQGKMIKTNLFGDDK